VGLFGPKPIPLCVRPRMGDFCAIAITNATLVTPKEVSEYNNGAPQGAHGSLLPAEMEIPLILCGT